MCWLLILCWLESLLVWLSLLFWILLLMISVGFSLFTGFFGAGLEYCVLNGEGFLSGVIGLKQWFLNLFLLQHIEFKDFLNERLGLSLICLRMKGASWELESLKYVKSVCPTRRIRFLTLILTDFCSILRKLSLLETKVCHH